MRHLAPHPEPVELTHAKPTLLLDWNRRSNKVRKVRRAIKDHLYRHQYGLCGYCEGSLGELGRHTEHVEPKAGIGGNPARTFDYSNLIASCQGDTDKPKPAQDASCGHYKDQQIHADGVYTPADFISPREPGCDQQFRYLLDGRVEPTALAGTADHRRAAYTLRLTGLDCLRLRNRRRQIAERHIRQIDRYKNDPVSLQRLINHYLGPRKDSNGTDVLLPFHTTRRQRFFP
ncbi:TIGR02646 family protein [Prosthecobacter debontii]|uniref:TIGR02646 family protein n=1 Tax=Prosthecobacter debontii TaxID=48467 RepID=A0A1T4Z1L1_9BACT|nr:retron system putative HNH endonuclease [Prosthecobacter debontii]SKB07924.1 TIGR02646 family protein [Prosthecobacter debontii]